VKDNRTLPRPRFARDPKVAEQEGIEWKEYPRIPPGDYAAYCYWSKRYYDPGMHRWTCLLRWDVLSDDLQQTIARCIPLWFPLGNGEKPRASRRGKYLPEWVRANGATPTPGDRLSPRVFTHRMARVEIGDTQSAVPYSVVKKILRWETRSTRHSISKSHSQDRQERKPSDEGGCDL
jgi:hypothetical protein